MEMNPIQLDALRECINIGAGHAATALSMMIQQPIHMSIPKIMVMPYEQVVDLVGQTEEAYAVVYVRVEGEAPGKALFFFPLHSAENLAKALLGTEEVNIFENEMAQSALMEIGNIMVGSFLVALAQFSGIDMIATVPCLAVDMAGAIMDAVLLEEGELNDTVLFVDTELSGLSDIEGKFMFQPSEGSLSKLLGVFGV